MPIVMKFGWLDGEEAYFPLVVCDHCGEPIDAASGGRNYLWNRAGEPLCFTHKACYRAFDRSKPGGYTCAEDIRELPAHLAHNIGLQTTPDAANRGDR